MNRAFSIYLDLVRFGAACLVFMYHSNQRWLVADILPLSEYGHASVVVFFVLSGFVIAWITDVKESDWRSYSASRLARVFSVVVPALAVCLLLDGIGRRLWAVPYEGYPFDNIPVRLAGSAAMLNEIWFVSITSLSNVPFWSVTYEFWYYVLFALVTFLPRPIAWWTAFGLCLVLGPKIVLLAPIWLLGVLLYRWRALQHMPLAWAWMAVATSTVLIIALHLSGFFAGISVQFEGLIGKFAYRQLTFSKFFVADYLLGLLVFAHFAGMRRVAPKLMPFLGAVARPVKWLAGYTFTLYLLHQPVFLFWGAVYRGPADTITSWLLVTAATAVTIWLVGFVTEHRRQHLRVWIDRWLHGLQLRFQRAGPHE